MKLVSYKAVGKPSAAMLNEDTKKGLRFMTRCCLDTRQRSSEETDAFKISNGCALICASIVAIHLLRALINLISTDALIKYSFQMPLSQG